MIVDYIKNRMIKQNKNFLGIFTGPTGSGKSWCCLRMGELIDDKFDISRVAFSAEEFLNLTNSSLPPGSVILFDEIGAAMAAREWQTSQNIVLSKIFQVFRHQNLCIFFSTPMMSFIDVNLRKLFQGYFETIRINRQSEVVTTKYMTIQVSPRSGKPYFKYPFVWNGNQSIKLTTLDIRKPSPGLICDYEAKKIAFTQVLREEAAALILKEKEKKGVDNTPADIRGIAAEVLGDMSYYKGQRSLLDRPLIMAEFDVGRLSADKIISLVKANKRIKKKNELRK